MEKMLEAIFELVVREAKMLKGAGGTTKEGHSFEDSVSQTVHKFSKQLGLKSNPARHILNLPTFSGVKHQFDASFGLDDVTYVIECKRRKMSTKDQIYYFNSRIVDYVLGLKSQNVNHKLKGLFLSTAEVDDNSLVYSLAYGITVIDPSLPPIEYAIATCADENVKQALERLKERMPYYNPLHDDKVKPESSPETLLKEYRFLLQRWKATRGG